MPALHRLSLIVVLTLPLAAAAQTAGRRTIEEAMRLLESSYIEPLKADTLASRCLTGMESWLRDRHVAFDSEDLPEDPAKRVVARLNRTLLQHPVEGSDPRLADACVRAMVEGLDRYTEYMDADEVRNKIAFGRDGRTAGIGLELKLVDGLPVIVSRIEGAPAGRSELRDGDVILAVDDKPMRGLALREVVDVLRGRPDTVVAVTVSRKGLETTPRYELKREPIRVRTVRTQLTPAGNLYLRVTAFQTTTLADLQRALETNLGRDPKLTGIVLDLRENTGGLLHTAVGVAAAFLEPSALVVEAVGRAPGTSEKFFARKESYDPRGAQSGSFHPAARLLPMVVLVNHRTASGAEIVAAALQDHGRAKIVGEPTFGQGSIQTIAPLGSDTALKLTTARFFRPAGQAIERLAVTPDAAIAGPESPRPIGIQDDPALWAADALLVRAGPQR